MVVSANIGSKRTCRLKSPAPELVDRIHPRPRALVASDGQVGSPLGGGEHAPQVGPLPQSLGLLTVIAAGPGPALLVPLVAVEDHCHRV